MNDQHPACLPTRRLAGRLGRGSAPHPMQLTTKETNVLRLPCARLARPAPHRAGSHDHHWRPCFRRPWLRTEDTRSIDAVGRATGEQPPQRGSEGVPLLLGDHDVRFLFREGIHRDLRRTAGRVLLLQALLARAWHGADRMERGSRAVDPYHPILPPRAARGATGHRGAIYMSGYT